MHVLVADLHEARARFGEQLLGHQQPVAQVAQIGVDAQLPGVAEGLDDLRLAAEAGVVAVLDVAVADADLPVGVVLDAIGRVDVDHLHLALHALPLQQAAHHHQAVALDQAVGPLVGLLVVVGGLVELVDVLVVGEEVVDKQVVLPRLFALEAVQALDELFGGDVLGAVEGADVDVEGVVVVLRAVFAQPVQLRVLPAGGDRVERQFCLARLVGFEAGLLLAGDAGAGGLLVLEAVDLLVGHACVQSSTASPDTLANSRVLLVTSVSPRARAWAAIQLSLAPMGCPAFSRWARMSP